MLVTKEPLIQTMACVNWPDTYPDRPEVEFDVRCTGEELLLAFRVREEFTRAVCAADRENIWEDSCVEFFFAPDADGLYYNFECSCIGKLLLCCGRGRENRVSLPEEAYSAVRRRGSLGALRNPADSGMGAGTRHSGAGAGVPRLPKLQRHACAREFLQMRKHAAAPALSELGSRGHARTGLPPSGIF